MNTDKLSQLRRSARPVPPLRELLASHELVRDYLDADPATCQLLAADKVIEIAGMKKKPNKYRAYCEFRLGYAFPVVSSYRTAIHSGTLARHWETMVDQNFNYGHQIARYYRGTEEETRIQNDRIIGAIVGVEPDGRPDSFRLDGKEGPPGLRCVAALFKQAKGMDRILGQHLSSRREWTVSMEIDYRLEESGVALMPRKNEAVPAEIPEKDAAIMAEHTPADFKAAGYGYMPLLQAPDDLIECFSEEQGVWAKPWHGYDIVTLLGGLNGAIHFKGAAIVQYGAEPTAEIDQVLAGAPAPENGNGETVVQTAERFGQSLERLAAALRE